MYSVIPTDNEMTLMIVTWLSAIVLNPVGTILSVTALFSQLGLVIARPDVGSLSTATLAAQGILFIAVGITWNIRLGPADEGGKYKLPSLFVWYNLVGFAVLDNITFAIVQLVLLFTARHKSAAVATAEEAATPDETSPLLDSQQA